MMISISQAFKIIGRQTAFAMLVLFACLMSFEWLLPGSVLPFIDLVDLLPLVLIAVFTVLIFTERGSTFGQVIQGVLGTLLGVALLFILYSAMQQIVSIRTVTLLISGGICLAVWIYAIKSKD